MVGPEGQGVSYGRMHDSANLEKALPDFGVLG